MGPKSLKNYKDCYNTSVTRKDALFSGFYKKSLCFFNIKGTAILGQNSGPL